jgi:raffinose/stachyose/melibiose transport system permease protein
MNSPRAVADISSSSLRTRQAALPGARSRWFRVRLVPLLFVAPILLLHVLLVAIPAVAGLYFSLTEWSGIGPATFIGLENFRRLLFEDVTYGRAFMHTLVWLVFFLTVPFALALFAASLLARVRRMGMMYRTLLFLPYIVPSVVSAAIWRLLLHPRLGVGAGLASVGIPGLDVAWLGRTDTVLLAIAFIDAWHYWGFLTVLFLTAMQAIPMELYESARIDGASRWHEFRHITLPGIRPTVVFMLIMTAIWSFRAFDYVWLLTQGGPAGASEILTTLLYKEAFSKYHAGYASAQGIMILFFSGAIIAAFIYVRRRGWDV